MTQLTTTQAAWLNLLSAALNGIQQDKDLLLQAKPQELYQLADSHKMLAVTAFALNTVGVYEHHFEQAKTKALRKLALFDIERKVIFAELTAAGIWHCPLKGVIMKNYYPQFGMREMSDNDILCDPDRMGDIRTIMEKLGFECDSYGEWHHDTYAKPPTLEFEMHHRLFKDDVMPGFKEYYGSILEKLIPVGEYEYRMTDEDFYLYLLAHEYKHFTHFGTGLRSLMDVYVFLKTHKALNWDYIRKELVKLKLTDFERHSRTLAQKVFTGQELDEEEAEQLVDFYLHSSLYGTIENGEYNSMTRSLGGRDDRKTKARYIFDRIFMRGENLKQDYPFVYRHKTLLPLLWIYRPIKAIFTHPKKILHDAKRVVTYRSPKHKL